MSAQGVYKITEDFESELCRYTGSKYAVATDSMTSALFISLMYEGIKGKEILIPNRTYMSVPATVLLLGGKVKFYETESEYLTGAYLLNGTNVWDSALRFSADMMGSFPYYHLVCLSFSGIYKHLRLGKGGAVLTDSKHAYDFLKRARHSGRNECSYHEDNFTQLGINAYMLPEIAAKGIFFMQDFYNADGSKKVNEDKQLKYPDLSKFEVYKTPIA